MGVSYELVIIADSDIDQYFEGLARDFSRDLWSAMLDYLGYFPLN